MTIRRFLNTALISCALIIGAGTAHAQSARITGSQLRDAVMNEGYRAKLDTDDYGDPIIFTSMGGWKTAILTYGCNSEGCNSIQFRVTFVADDASIEKANEWNNTKRYLRCYVNDEGDMVGEMDVVLVDGAEADQISLMLETLESSVSDLSDFVFE